MREENVASMQNNATDVTEHGNSLSLAVQVISKQ